MVYNSIIKPHFEFSATILFQAFQGDVFRLQVIQNKAMRCILKCRKIVPIRVMLSVLNWLSVDDNNMLLAMVFIFKIMNGLLPSYLADKIEYVSMVHNLGTRSATNRNLYLSSCNSSKWYKSIFYLGLRHYNLLPIDIKKIKSVGLFKIKCLEWMIRRK